jgi:antitoxin PrlF
METNHKNAKLAVTPREKQKHILRKFLDFLAGGVVENPQIVQPLTSDLRSRTSSLVAGVECDIDAPLPDEDE